MKKLAFEFAGSFDMPAMKVMKIEKENNIMFAGAQSTFTYNKGGNLTTADDFVKMLTDAEWEAVQGGQSGEIKIEA